METQPLLSEVSGEGPSAVQPRSCAEIWARTGQKILEEETTRSDVQLQNFRNVQYQEAEGPQGFHYFYAELEILREGGIHPVPHRSCFSGGSLKKIQVRTSQEGRLEPSCLLFLVELKQGLNLQLKRVLCPLRRWLFISPRRSGLSWILTKKCCIGKSCWKIISTWSLWVVIAMRIKIRVKNSK
ncbi:uncharacterized protein PHA67_014159 [Liasis olivaceus]